MRFRALSRHPNATGLGLLVASAAVLLAACTSQTDGPAQPKQAPVPELSNAAPPVRVQQTFESLQRAAFHDFAFAPDGDIVAVGSVARGIKLGEQTHRQRGSGDDILLARFSPDGVVRWSHHFGGRATQRGDHVALLPGGDIAIAGPYALVLSFDKNAEPVPYAGRFDLFLARFSPTGEFRWSKTFGGPHSEIAEGLVAREDGTLVIGGWFSKTFALGGPPLHAVDQIDGFLAHFNGDGSHIRSMSFGGTGSQQLTGLAQHPSGDLILGGTFERHLDLKNATIVTGTSAEHQQGAQATALIPDSAVPAAKTGTGPKQATKATTPPAPDSAAKPPPEATPTADTTTTGRNKPPPGTSLHTTGYPNLFVARISPEFELRWNRSFGATSRRRNLAGLETTATGDIIVAGTFEHSLDLGHGDMAATGLRDAYVAALAGDGTPTWQWSQGLAQVSVVVGQLGVRPQGDIVIAGYADDKEGAQAPFPLLARIAGTGTTRWSLTPDLWPNELRATSVGWSPTGELVVATVVEQVIEVPPGGNPAPIPVLEHLRIRVLPADPTTLTRP